MGELAFLLIGSSTPAATQVHHSGAGRIARLRMWPMALYETGHSDGSVSLSDLFDGKFEGGPATTGLPKLARLISLDVPRSVIRYDIDFRGYARRSTLSSTSWDTPRTPLGVRIAPSVDRSALRARYHRRRR